MSLNKFTKVKDMDTKESRDQEINEACLPGGFIDEETLEQINSINRFAQVLVRCGGGRFICSAQDAKHFIGIVTEEGHDYVRDVSIIPQG